MNVFSRLANSTMTYGTVVFVVLLSCQALGSNVDFRVTPSVVDPQASTNVTLTCSLGDYHYYHHHHSNKKISWIQIIKNKQDKWHTIAQMSAAFPNQVDIFDNTVTWSSGAVNVENLRSHLKIVWAKPSVEIYGEYRCDVIGILTNQEGDIFSSSGRLKIGNELDSLAILRLMAHENDVTSKRLNELVHGRLMADNQTYLLQSRVLENENRTLASLSSLESTLQEQVSKLQKIESDMKMYITELRSDLTNRSEVIDANIKLLIDSGFLMIWPRGSYGLLQPSSGCPMQGGNIWQDGWLRIHTESTDRNKDEISKNSHLAESAMTRITRQNFLSLHFCVKSDVNSTSPFWPSGSFCINKKGNCPSGFSQGSLKWDEEDDGENMTKSFSGTLPDNEDNYSVLYFCCRGDNNPNIPIFLPKGDPFYLYRYGGKCQQVHGMKVTEEFVHFDTENDKNSDARAGVYPDGTINDIRLELCYYEN